MSNSPLLFIETAWENINAQYKLAAHVIIYVFPFFFTFPSFGKVSHKVKSNNIFVFLYYYTFNIYKDFI